jgi:hypothetical protein
MSEQTTSTTETEGTAPGTGYRFLSGPDMDPTTVRTTYPGARFVARAYLSDAPAAGPDDATWGIIIRLTTASPAADAGPQRQATTDDGRVLTVTLASDSPPADAAATLAAAKYWELPPAYVARLARS